MLLPHHTSTQKEEKMLLSDFLLASAQKHPLKTALIDGDRTITYGRLDELSSRLGNGLLSEGIKRQDRIAVYLENSVESVISIFGILKAGGVFVIINPQVKSKKLSYIINDCQVTTLITDRSGASLILDGTISCPHLKTILITSYEVMQDGIIPQTISDLVEGKGNFLKAAAFGEFLMAHGDTEPPRSSIDIDLASLMYTSGSTGNPKGVMLTHLNMVTAARSIIQYLENEPDDIILNYLPLSFDYGLYQVLMGAGFGGTVVLEKAFVYPYQAVQKILDMNITGLPLVPAMAALLLQLKDLHTYDFSRVRYITNTGQAFPPAHIRQLQKAFNNARVYSMYGLTECKRVAYLPPSELQNRPLSVGKAIPNTEVWLIDEQGNRIDTPWTVGELVIRGAHVMKGYWNKAQETAAVLRPGIYPDEKILLSRDYFKMDEEGFLYFVSRKDDVIKSGGERISPKEIEDVIYEMDGVSEVAVIGVPDTILGYALKAFVAFKEGADCSEEDVRKHCREHLEHNRVPKFIELREMLPKSSNGKIRKKDLEIEESSAV